MAAPALIALAHGSRDPRSAETITALVDEVRALRPDLRIEPAFLELSKPSFATVGRPSWSAPATTRSSWCRCCSARPTTPRSTCPPPSPSCPPGTRGCRSAPPASSVSSPPSWRSSTCGCARHSRRPGSASSTPWCWPRPAPATRSPTRPWPGWPGSGAPATSCRSRPRSPRPRRRPPVRRCGRSGCEGRRHIAVASLFLAPGFLPDRAAELAREAGAVAVSAAAGRPPGAGADDPGAVRRRRRRAGPGLTHQRGQQALQLPGRVGGHAAVHRPGLEHRRPRRLEEAEPGADRLLRHGSPACVTDADALDERQPGADLVHVEARVQRAQPVRARPARRPRGSPRPGSRAPRRR